MIHVVNAYFRHNDRSFYEGEAISEAELADRGLDEAEREARLASGHLRATDDPEPEAGGGADAMGEALAAAVAEDDKPLAEDGGDQTMTKVRRRTPKE